jgi:ELWxxDGT repeat protein
MRFRDRVYFFAANAGAGESLWRTDGTAAGTTRVLDLTLDGLPSWGRGLTVAAGRLFLTVYNETTGAELWASTGEAAGTARVGDIAPGRDASSPGPFTALPTVVMTGADDGIHGREPWAIPRAEVVRPPQ